MRSFSMMVGLVVAVGLASSSRLLSDEKGAGNDDGFVPLFVEPGVPKGWVVRAWNDVAEPAEAGAAWRVDAEGVLHGSEPRGTWLVSEQEYGDFVLAFEFKLPPQGNSGCGLRFPGKGDPAFDGLELQMVDVRYYGGQPVGADELTGSLYQAITPRATPFKPGEWNAYHIRCEGPLVRVELNGELLIDVNLDEIDRPLKRGEPLKARPRRGHIGFQELSRGGGHVQIRNAKLKVLDAPAAPGAVVIDISSAAGGEATILVDGEKVEHPQLRDTLRTRRDAKPDAPPTFSLRADEAVPYGVVENVLIDLAMSLYETGRIETRAGASHPFIMPVKTKGEVKARPSVLDVRVTMPDGKASVEVGGTTVSDLGEPLVRLLTEARTGAAAGTIAAVWPDAAVPYADVVRAYAACQAAGFEHVVFRTSPR